MGRVLTTSSVAALLLVAGCSVVTPSPADEPGPSSGDTSARARSVNVATPDEVKASRDAFGIRKVYRTRPDGTLWTSNWAEDRDFDGVDPLDPWFDADHGSATYKVRSGKLAVTGEIPRMYVYDPQRKRQWRDVETTMYFKRVEDTGIPYAGMTIVARSNHLDTESGRYACDTRGYGARMRYDGHIDFEKETDYPYNEAVANKDFWPDELPRNRWVGVKFVVYDDADDRVHLEMWVDLAGGRAGGRWQKVNEVIDGGNLFGDRPCADGIDPQATLLNDATRAGSESGKPNLTVFFRSDGVAEDGLLYKWGSVREIVPRR